MGDEARSTGGWTSRWFDELDIWCRRENKFGGWKRSCETTHPEWRHRAINTPPTCSKGDVDTSQDDEGYPFVYDERAPLRSSTGWSSQLPPSDREDERNVTKTNPQETQTNIRNRYWTQQGPQGHCPNPRHSSLSTKGCPL